MKINSTQLLSAYEATRTFSSEDEAITTHFRPVEKIFEDKKTKSDAVVMVYGVYNAGKSTLINALLGSEEAATDDIPLTDKVSAYQWDQFTILDTPGVDAPIEHEHVTKEQMLKSDAIIFVVDPVGTSEEAKTLSVLMDLQQAGKRVFIVMNEKKAIGEEDFIRLKDQIRERLQHMAAERGLHDVLKSIPIVRVNAKRALQGKIQRQPKLVELSGYSAFEKQLQGFLQSISPNDIYGRLKVQLVSFLEEYVTVLNNRSNSETAKNYDKLIQKITVEKATLRQQMERELLRHRVSIYDRSKSFVRSTPEGYQAHIEGLLEGAAKDVEIALNNNLRNFISTVHTEVEELQASLPIIAYKSVNNPLMKLQAAPTSQQVEKLTEASRIDAALLKGAIGQIATLAKPEHIVSSLQLAKSALPSLMKGIGTKTMEKWAATALAKWIPYAGAIISALSIVSDIFSGDSEEKSLRQQTEEQQRAKERALQQIDDFALEISNGFENSMREIVQSELEKFFSNMLDQVNSLRQDFNSIERENSFRLEKLLEIKNLAVTA